MFREVFGCQTSALVSPHVRQRLRGYRGRRHCRSDSITGPVVALSTTSAPTTETSAVGDRERQAGQRERPGEPAGQAVRGRGDHRGEIDPGRGERTDAQGQGVVGDGDVAAPVSGICWPSHRDRGADREAAVGRGRQRQVVDRVPPTAS